MMTRSCFTCGTTITVTSRNPNRRLCSPRCRKMAWQAQNRRARTSVTNAVAEVVHDVADAVPAANGVNRCPHCRQELAVIAADAAHIRTPGGDHIALP
jgi:endogenous inhibitor of DNA gyrase (YacG/DUF329 family)